MALSDHQRKIARALENNEGVWFSTHHDHVAVWYGGPTVNIYCSLSWKQIDTMEIGLAYRTDDLEEIQNAVEVRLGRAGYVRKGREGSSETPVARADD